MVDFLGASLVDWRTRDGRDLLREPLAIEPDERRELFAISGQAGLLEGTEPGGAVATWFVGRSNRRRSGASVASWFVGRANCRRMGTGRSLQRVAGGRC